MSISLTSLLWDHYKPRRTNLKESSALQLQYSIAALERFHARPICTRELNDTLLLTWLTDRISKVSRATVRRDLGNLLTLWRFAKRRGFCESSPPDDIDPVDVPPTIPRAWTLDELGAILDVCRSLKGWMRNLPILRRDWFTSNLSFIYDTGARITATLAIRPDELYLDKLLCLLRTEAAKTTIEQLVPFSDETAGLIARHLEPGRTRVWPYPWCKKKIWMDLKEIHRLAGVDCGKYVGFHRLRKTNATQTVIVAGWDAARVALGHTSEKMTRRYVDLRQVPRTRVELPRPTPKQAG